VAGNPDFIREGDAQYAQITRAFKSEGGPRRMDWAGTVWERRKDNGSVFYANVSPSSQIDSLYGGHNAFDTRPPEPAAPTAEGEPAVPLADISLYAPEGQLPAEREPVLDLETELDLPVEPGHSLGDALLEDDPDIEYIESPKIEGRVVGLPTIDQGGPVRSTRKGKPKA
jgi:hypothetical protein